MLTDVHRHGDGGQPNVRVVLSHSLRSGAMMLDEASGTGLLYHSVGIHPWEALDWIRDFPTEPPAVLLREDVVLIGEIGLDKACDVPFDLQQTVFDQQLNWAERLGKPVLLHVVRAWDDLSIHRRRHPSVSGWIVHGFRGKPALADQLVRAGFHLSFGVHYHPESLRRCPLDRLFLETDDDVADLEDLFVEASALREMDVQDLETAVESNFQRLTGVR